MRPDRLAALDKAHVWHPFTQMKGWLASEPLVVERGEGFELVATDGRRYLDGVSSLWVTVHGHQVPEIDASIREQLGRIAHSTLLGLANGPSAELAAELVRLAPPGLEKVFYSEAGACAVEVALKMAFSFWRHRGVDGRTTFLSLENAYHGDTLGAVAVGGIDLFHEAYRPLLFPALKAPSPYCYRCPLGLTYPDCGIACAERLGEILAERRAEIAAVVVEPLVQGAGGMITAPPGHLRRVRELCDRYDVLLIVDEVATGVGRTGRFFACEHEGVSPDILVAGKGITGGYLPLAVTMTTQRIFDAFLGEHDEFRTFFHGHTYTGNPLACAAALANLDLMAKRDTVGGVAERAAVLAAALAPLAGHPHVGEVRQRGLMVGIELVAERTTRAPYPAAARTGMAVAERARDEGVIIRPLSDVVVLMPPLAMPAPDIERLAAATIRAIDHVTLGPAAP
jgi:adenosylmethionine---8-amino-7-oxononanoate aminotransferase